MKGGARSVVLKKHFELPRANKSPVRDPTGRPEELAIRPVCDPTGKRTVTKRSVKTKRSYLLREKLEELKTSLLPHWQENGTRSVVLGQHFELPRANKSPVRYPTGRPEDLAKRPVCDPTGKRTVTKEV